MPAPVVLDSSVFDQINRGNKNMAEQLKRLYDSKTPLWITNELSKTLSSTPANRQLIVDLSIQSPMQDKMPNERNPTPDERVQLRRLDNLPYKSMATGSLAFEKKAQLMTANRELSEAFRRQGGQILESYAPQNATGAVDYNVARENLGLSELNILKDGTIGPKPAPRRVYHSTRPAHDRS